VQEVVRGGKTEITLIGTVSNLFNGNAVTGVNQNWSPESGGLVDENWGTPTAWQFRGRTSSASG